MSLNAMIWARRAFIWSGVNETGVEGGRGAAGTGPDATDAGAEGGAAGGSDAGCGTWPFRKGGCVWGWAPSGCGEQTKSGAEERRTELVLVLLLLLCLLLLALERSEVGEEIAQFLGRLWGMAGLLEVADTLWVV